MRTLSLELDAQKQQHKEEAPAAAATTEGEAASTEAKTEAATAAKSLEDENRALKQELTVVYARMDKLAQMFLSRLNSVESKDVRPSSVKVTVSQPDGSAAAGTKDDKNELEELRKLLLSSEEERRQVRLSAETARRDVETVVGAIRALTLSLEQLRVKILGNNSKSTSASGQSGEEKNAGGADVNLSQMVLGIHGELENSVTRFRALVEELDRETTRIANPFSVDEMVALLKQEKRRLEADVEDMTVRLERSDTERVFTGSALLQFIEAEDKDKRAIFMQLAEVLRLSAQDRERALAKIGVSPAGRSFLSRLKIQ